MWSSYCVLSRRALGGAYCGPLEKFVLKPFTKKEEEKIPRQGLGILNRCFSFVNPQNWLYN
jgi:mannitol-specific phosphotransferase system IIBC component